MTGFFRWLVVLVIKIGTSISCRIEKFDLEKVPLEGAMILAANHIGSLEVPLLLAYLQPRRMISLAKIETWNNRFMGWLFDLWEAIPIRRGDVDLTAVRLCLTGLSEGKMLFIAPEGTRSRDGKLLRGQPGIVMIALRAGVPILPIVHWGGENYLRNLKSFKRTDFHIRVGKAFTLEAKGEKVNGKLRQEMADEIMGQIAILMPVEYRGQYANYDQPSEKYLHFVEN
jgi:1-acyl-sn-glycerol-3-phosphate acyltransferase